MYKNKAKQVLICCFLMVVMSPCLAQVLTQGFLVMGANRPIGKSEKMGVEWANRSLYIPHVHRFTMANYLGLQVKYSEGHQLAFGPGFETHPKEGEAAKFGIWLNARGGLAKGKLKYFIENRYRTGSEWQWFTVSHVQYELTPKVSAGGLVRMINFGEALGTVGPVATVKIDAVRLRPEMLYNWNTRSWVFRWTVLFLL